MIPPKSDPKWREIVVSRSAEHFSALPTQMLMMRVYLLTRDGTSQKIDEAIDVVYDFFLKNENVVKEDILKLFNNRETF